MRVKYLQMDGECAELRGQYRLSSGTCWVVRISRQLSSGICMGLGLCDAILLVTPVILISTALQLHQSRHTADVTLISLLTAF
jgi:hypothetical protein